jgi:hypothetical protein
MQEHPSISLHRGPWCSRVRKYPSPDGDAEQGRAGNVHMNGDSTWDLSTSPTTALTHSCQDCEKRCVCLWARRKRLASSRFPWDIRHVRRLNGALTLQTLEGAIQANKQAETTA